MWVTSSRTAALTPTAVALGNFDGLHLGHQQVVQPILHRTARPESFAPWPQPPQRLLGTTRGEGIAHSQDIDGGEDSEPVEANQFGCSFNAGERLYPTVLTFNPHPQEFFSGQPRKLLTPPAEKVELLQAMGVEQLVLLPFDRELAALTPTEFVSEVLVRQLQAEHISVGGDFQFGRNRSGTAADLQAIASSYGISVTLVPLYTCSGERISSSAIRQALQSGDLQGANLLLGRSYRLVGKVVPGQQLGRTIGFPTANLQLPPEKFLPRFGVYAVRVFVKEEGASPPCETSEAIASGPTSAPLSCLQGVMNIGCRPTVGGESPTVEVHLLDWSGDLYGKTLTVSLEQFLRPEQKFLSLEALKAQIQADCEFAKRALAANG